MPTTYKTLRPAVLHIGPIRVVRKNCTITEKVQEELREALLRLRLCGAGAYRWAPSEYSAIRCCIFNTIAPTPVQTEGGNRKQATYEYDVLRITNTMMIFLYSVRSKNGRGRMWSDGRRRDDYCPRPRLWKPRRVGLLTICNVWKRWPTMAVSTTVYDNDKTTSSMEDWRRNINEPYYRPHCKLMPSTIETITQQVPLSWQDQMIYDNQWHYLNYSATSDQKERLKTIACGRWPSLGTSVQPVEERSPSTRKGRQLQAAMAMDKSQSISQFDGSQTLKSRLQGGWIHVTSTSTSMATRGIQGTTTIELQAPWGDILGRETMEEEQW